MEKREMIDLKEAQRRLGSGVVICLEPEEIMKKKVFDGKAEELWVFDPATGRSGRGDQKFFDARYIDRGGWGQPAIYEEPKVEPDEDGERIVGHVVVQQMGNLIRVRKAKGLSRDIIELMPSSLSKGELCEIPGCKPAAHTEANPQRIMGDMMHFLLKDDFPPEEGMTVAEFIDKTTDGRSLNALVKTGLLIPAE